MIETSILEIAANLGGTVFTVTTFLIYLYKKSLLDKHTYDSFNTTIANHLKSSNKIIEFNTKGQLKFVASLQKLTDCIENLNNK